MSFSTCIVKGTYFRRNQHNYPHGSKARRKVALTDSFLAVLRNMDRDGDPDIMGTAVRLSQIKHNTPLPHLHGIELADHS